MTPPVPSASPGPAYDLHTHSLRSDGTLAPAAVVDLAARAGLAGLALTDHDTTAGWVEAAAACAARGLTFVPGIELSAEARGHSVHLLGYWVDAGDPDLVAECERLRGERDVRATAMLSRLRALGVEVSAERVRAIAGGAPVGRPHIAAAMVEAGTVAGIDEAFDRYLADGRPAFQPKQALDAADAVGLLRAAGGVAVLAHPGCSGIAPALFDRLADAGLAGVECDHPGHEPALAERWRRETLRRGLVVTGASDFHGNRKEVKIGERTTSQVAIDTLRARAVPFARTVPDAPGTAVRKDSSW